MTKALQDAKVDRRNIDYVNAHAPSTSIGDASEMKALKSVFILLNPLKFLVQSLDGHGLSLSSIMEAAFCGLAPKKDFFLDLPM